jgi:uncharacterized surface protein with fasciclin (FAS1) repeats
MVMNILTPLAFATSILLSGSAPGPGGNNDQAMNIVEVAASSGSFNTLVQAVKAAGLVETLSGDAPFTALATSDEAFARIPQADLEALLADKAALAAVLVYHVVPGRVYAKDVVNLSSAETENGQSVKV